jgi:hypothetical protein
VPGIEECLTEMLAIPGVLDALVVDHTTATAVAVAGSGRHLDAERSAVAVSETMRAMLDGLARTTPGGTLRIQDVIVMTDRGHHLLCPLRTALDADLVVYLRLDLDRANVALARHHLRAISGRLVTA